MTEGFWIGWPKRRNDEHGQSPKETGGRVALPVFKELMLRVYREKLVGRVPEFPAQMEQSINAYLAGDSPDAADMLVRDR